MADDKNSDVPPDVTPPDLNQPWGLWGPSITGNPRGTNSDGNTTPVSQPPTHPAYVVSPGSIGYGATQILISTEQNIGVYNDLKSTVADTKAWIFWAPNSNPQRTGGTGSHAYGIKNTGPIPDPDPELTAQLSAIEDNLLLEIADAITLAGQFVDVLNNAAQFYTQADKSSVLPELSTSFVPQTPSALKMPNLPDAT
ncbi:hypothetical protein GCM10023322_55010 [Rugosimonospora acidiphila]|uniref:Uncharacterized protein n=1 Tax=Rugosimonospora acidiphila TaxID=556531 RepID=A0ABP9SAQ1_9ACTN